VGVKSLVPKPGPIIKIKFFYKMKRFQNFGRSLNKQEQKMLMGGNPIPPEGAGCDCGCTSDSQCGIMVCSKTVSTGDCGISGQTCPGIRQCVNK
jgi:hypothetical protein